MATILIVDDDATSLDLLVTILGYSENRLLLAQDGEEALKVAETELPGLIITDILMPKMYGFTLIRRLSADPRLRRVPVIFQTANYLENEARILVEACSRSSHRTC